MPDNTSPLATGFARHSFFTESQVLTSTAASPLTTPGGRSLGRGLDDSPCISGASAGNANRGISLDSPAIAVSPSDDFIAVNQTLLTRLSTSEGQYVLMMVWHMWSQSQHGACFSRASHYNFLIAASITRLHRGTQDRFVWKEQTCLARQDNPELASIKIIMVVISSATIHMPTSIAKFLYPESL